MFLEVDGLSKQFGSIHALTNVSFHWNAAEVLGLIGPNGAGKSTLFECLAGLSPADGGEVRIDGRAVLPEDRSSQIFYVPDGIAPWPDQSVGWALDYAIGYFGGREELHGVVIEQLSLGPLLRQKIGTLSKGERKRALLAIGLLTPQPGLLIDEPFDGLDLRQAREIARVLREQAEQGRTLFLSIHQISDSERFCDRFVLLSSGRVRGEGTVAELAAVASMQDASRSYSALDEVFLALT